MWIVRLAPTPAIATSESDRAVWRGDPALEGALRSGLVVDSATPAIQAFADSVASRGGGNPTAEALLLEKAVYHRIRLKDYSTVMGTASETLARGRGDCTEHAVLLGAVCRARGIPARLVAGLTPAGAEQMAWHLWTEVWLGSWVALDATRGLGAPAPATVALLRMERPEDEIGNLERSIGVLSAGYRFRVSEETR
jgi:transglutaminase-like putative cysteine protease